MRNPDAGKSSPTFFSAITTSLWMGTQSTLREDDQQCTQIAARISYERYTRTVRQASYGAFAVKFADLCAGGIAGLDGDDRLVHGSAVDLKALCAGKGKRFLQPDCRQRDSVIVA